MIFIAIYYIMNTVTLSIEVFYLCSKQNNNIIISLDIIFLND